MCTELPARASCSPHIEPDGPPPTITIAAIRFLSGSSGMRLRAARPSGDGENRQRKSSEEYSTEKRSSRDRACLSAYYIARQPLQNCRKCTLNHEGHANERH